MTGLQISSHSASLCTLWCTWDFLLWKLFAVILSCVLLFFLLVLLDGALFWESFKCALLHVTRGQGGCSGQNESQTGGDVEENNVFSKVRCVNFLSLLVDLVFFFTDGVQYSKWRWFCVAWRYFSKSPWSVINKISLKVNRYI